MELLELSKQVDTELDKIGFSGQCVHDRIHNCKKISAARDISTKRIRDTNLIQTIIVGSQIDGTGFDLTNDRDFLIINHGVVCKTDLDTFLQTEDVTFEMMCENAPPGYCYLRLVRSSQNTETFARIKHALVHEKNSQLISSEKFMNSNNCNLPDVYINKMTHIRPRQGPSIPTDQFFFEAPDAHAELGLVNTTNKKNDNVHAFPCRADHILQAWCSRERKYNWPSKKTIAHVVTLPAHVVPVGQRGSARQDLQWRLCFTLAEIHLVQSFNNTQTKMFFLLKLIAKHYLQPVCKYITSYIMKTVMLWLAESIPQEIFQPEYLLQRLHNALVFLKQGIVACNLSSYMIPDRNLFAGIQHNEQQDVLNKIDFLLTNGQKLISDFIYSPEQKPQDWVKAIFNKHVDAYEMDKKTRCQYDILTTGQLAEKFSSMYLCKTECSYLICDQVYAAVIYCYECVLKHFKLHSKHLQKVRADDLKNENASFYEQLTNDTNVHLPDTRKFIDKRKADKVFVCLLFLFEFFASLLMESVGHFPIAFSGHVKIVVILASLLYTVSSCVWIVCWWKVLTKQTHLKNCGSYRKKTIIIYVKKNFYYTILITSLVIRMTFIFLCVLFTHSYLYINIRDQAQFLKFFGSFISIINFLSIISEENDNTILSVSAIPTENRFSISITSLLILHIMGFCQPYFKFILCLLKYWFKLIEDVPEILCKNKMIEEIV